MHTNRALPPEGALTRFGGFTFTGHDGKLVGETGFPVYLSLLESAVLAHLLRNQRRIVEPEELEDLLRQLGSRNRNLRKASEAVVSRVRAKIVRASSRKGRGLIATFVARGYQLFSTPLLARRGARRAEAAGLIAYFP